MNEILSGEHTICMEQIINDIDNILQLMQLWEDTGSQKL